MANNTVKATAKKFHPFIFRANLKLNLSSCEKEPLYVLMIKYTTKLLPLPVAPATLKIKRHFYLIFCERIFITNTLQKTIITSFMKKYLT